MVIAHTTPLTTEILESPVRSLDGVLNGCSRRVVRQQHDRFTQTSEVEIEGFEIDEHNKNGFAITSLLFLHVIAT
jgi:hypothetical protein